MKEKNSFKFRAWHEPKKIMLDVIAINFSLMEITADIENRKIYPELDYWWKETDIPFSEILLTQSTGLKDRNGVEIYEGDIVDVGTRIPFLNKIERDEETGYLKLVPIDKRWTESYFTSFEDKSRYEILGNIYENLELLEIK